MVSGCVPGYLAVVNYCFVGFYTLEALATLFVYRARVCRDHWTLFDLCIVLMAWVDMLVSAIVTTAGLQEVQLLRLFRIARLARAARIVHMSPELRAMMNGVISALTTVFWGLIMVMLLLAVWAVLAVELLHDTAQDVHADKPICAEAFDSVFMVMLMFFQTLMAGDSWGSLLTVQLGFANLVLDALHESEAVIVERARQAHEEEQRQNLSEQIKKRREAENRLLEMCQRIDVDKDGAWDFRKTLLLLEIDETDLICLFDLMDVDRSGDLTYEETVQDIWLRIRDHLTDAQENIISSVRGEVRKPSLLDAKTYLIRKLTSSSSFAKKTSNVSNFKKHLQAGA
ncbi:Voltage-dependent T-type calcium channel subunit alpha-1I (CaVT.3) (Voltage-gated calcium channel subunit alpha Cav3.3) [Durusdinium trenchii]|uniref:Voltage-dependent T-type calcium channel subunit alpha-1I (CaVT.3) (Voltage-gated calcium channel subunit alpha Cav3.3) n=1 Tax=Durusdinium trenchii TaxID=1381693 RepID=A0ABP0PCD1_9DINO